MPELPEVETVARDLQRRVTGSRIASVEVSKADVLRVAGARALAKRTTGAAILRCWRRAKLVVLDLSTHDRLVVSLRFTGALLIDDATVFDGTGAPPRAHASVLVTDGTIRAAGPLNRGSGRTVDQ